MARIVFAEPSDYDGAITEEMRERLRQRRLMLGLGYQELGRLLHVTMSTARKWEDGTIGRCRHSHASRLLRFLDGEFDTGLLEASRSAAPHYGDPDGGASPMLLCMEQLSSIYRLCGGNPELEAGLVRDVNDVLDKQTTRLRRVAGGGSGTDNDDDRRE